MSLVEKSDTYRPRTGESVRFRVPQHNGVVVLRLQRTGCSARLRVHHQLKRRDIEPRAGYGYGKLARFSDGPSHHEGDTRHASFEARQDPHNGRALRRPARL